MTNILILYTGGTIGMTHDPDSGVLRPFDFKQVVMHLSELKKLNCHIDFHALKPVIDSSDMQPEIWVDLVLLIEKNYTKYDEHYAENYDAHSNENYCDIYYENYKENYKTHIK